MVLLTTCTKKKHSSSKIKEHTLENQNHKTTLYYHSTPRNFHLHWYLHRETNTFMAVKCMYSFVV